MIIQLTVKAKLLLLLIFFTALRLISAYLTNLGNDEVYYILYARHPDFSHFDHPPMIGFLIQITTLNLLLQDELFIRLGPIILSILTSLILFRSVSRFAGEQAGFYTVALFHASIYFSIISSLFVMPDAPQIFFLALALEQGLIMAGEKDKYSKKHLLLFGVFLGLATLSKYTSLYYWLGILIFFAVFQRFRFRSVWLYLSGAITIVFTIPIIWWNLTSEYSSFVFHAARIISGGEVRWDYFFTELGGQIAYQSPLVFALVIISLVKLKTVVQKHGNLVFLLLLLFIPLVVTFLIISLQRSTLPHWSGPGYLSALVLAGLVTTLGVKVLRHIAGAALFLSATALILGTIVINTGFMMHRTPPRHDFTLDMYGWDQVKSALIERHPEIRNENTFIVCSNWFPAAHFDHYLAHPLGLDVYVRGTILRSRKFHQVNVLNGAVAKGSTGIFLSNSRFRRELDPAFGEKFFSVSPPDSIPVLRRGMPAGYVYFRLYENSLRTIEGYEFNLQ